MSSDVIPDARLENATCLACGYALRGLKTSRCPECGRGFDPADVMTFVNPARDEALRRSHEIRLRVYGYPMVGWVLAMMVAAIVTTSLTMRSDRAALMLTPGLSAAWFVRRRMRAKAVNRFHDGHEPAPRSERAFSVAVVIACAVLSVPWWPEGKSCPHATGWRVGPFVVARSTNGGPCRGSWSRFRAWTVGHEWYVGLM